MLSISRLETRFQEIIFLLTLMLSLSVAIGGVFYLNLTPESFISAAGYTGSALIKKGFSSFGYTYFFMVLFFLHIGHLILATSHNLRDMLRSHIIYLRNFAIYFAVLLLISSFLTVLESYNNWPVHELFAYGYGGWFGSVLGGALFRGFGLFGALVILFSVTSVIGISAGYMEIVHSFYIMKDIIKELVASLREKGPLFIKEVIAYFSDFLGREPQYATALQPQRKPVPKYNFQVKRSSAALPGVSGRLATDHFHTPKSLGNISTNEESKVESSDKVNDIVQSTASVQIAEPVNEVVEKAKPEESAVTEETINKESSAAKPKAKKTTKKKGSEEAQASSEDDSVKEAAEVIENKPLVEIESWTKRYKKVETSLLEKPEKKILCSEAEIREICKVLSERLESFGIKGEVLMAHQGVTLTMFEFQPAAGMKLSKIQSLSDDLALVLGAKAIRILTPIPGKTTVGIEVPNKEIAILRFSEMVATCMKKKTMELPVPLGIDVYNKVHVNDLTKMPHLLVSGTTGSGKSVFMNSLISGLIFHKSPKELRFLMIDPKMIELSPYNGIPHLLKPVVTDVEEAKNLLLWAEKEMDRRYQIFADTQSKNIISFNSAVKKTSKRAIEGRLGKKVDWKFEEMPYIVIVIDELADLMLTQRNEVERPITRIAQKARAAGIHMVMATQRPSADIVTGLIKTNFPTRVSFKVSSGIDSRTILDQPGAEKLLGNGDMLYLAQGKAIERLQGGFMTEDEVKKVVRAVSSQGKTNKK